MLLKASFQMLHCFLLHRKHQYGKWKNSFLNVFFLIMLTGYGNMENTKHTTGHSSLSFSWKLTFLFLTYKRSNRVILKMAGKMIQGKLKAATNN